MDTLFVSPDDGARQDCSAQNAVTINRTFKNARRKLRLSQREFAAQLQVDFVWLSKLENERLPVPENHAVIMALLPKLAAIAKLDLEWLQSLKLYYQTESSPPAFEVVYKALGR
ncbi:helix-turn-helix transcriptional regulator [Leptolyngbya sp. FACHB-541]|uniref:helix-turn-helix domain-containing protein n=1 Tax=Leptolyngbya sp. FACHB-541 TaxID=2692810 RepID=UPI0016897206|nr:helix-turn-helix transcriptional regulator [Leptolyngbya sp. FACHB-541]MBD1995178.1 helix-turn-helix transcriptional regulator [Leptolyngbya sp. FACHB-541]